MIPEATLRKVRSMLAMAEDPSVTEAEAEAFTAKAMKWISEYGIDMAVATAKQPTSDILTDKQVTLPGPRAMAKANLFCLVADAMRCKALRIPKRRGQGDGTQTVHIFGYASDIERFTLVHASLELQMMNGLAQVTPPPRASARKYKTAWCVGFANRVAERIESLEKTAQQEAVPQEAQRSTELVLMDRNRAVQQRVASEYERTVTRRTSVLSSGYGAGAAAGARADIGQSRLSDRAALGR
ncbi:DUF2786 domain-containing protein [Nocardiopsis exhalans]|uniref:DUF2786 domain-containing protein n=1 Tax=Nocardiopsis exhalans TaxID=163604 RepID=A0ABY5DF14_9ACTN|nr:DUF2786 domain-containing protein [Nocardiopsis exhalans]USY21788.1 DUF2786 domain-containing protein [Nocardiopsis exhalans]